MHIAGSVPLRGRNRVGRVAMEKKTVSAKAIVSDIKDGVDDFELMRRYELSPGQLQKVLTKLVASGRLTQDDIDARKPKKEARVCPFCNAENAGEAVKCVQCGKFLDERPIPSLPRPADSLPGLAASRFEEPAKSCPWEDRDELGWVQAYIKTLIACIFSPKDFFSSMPVGTGYLGPFLFATITIILGSILTPFWSLLFKANFGLMKFVGALALVLIGTPLFVIIGFGLAALLNHLGLLVLGAAKENYDATFSVVCYAAAAQIFSVVPILGSLVAGILGIVLTVIGLREVHRTSTGQAIVAMLLPVVVCVGLIALLAGVIMSALGTFMGQMMQMPHPMRGI